MNEKRKNYKIINLKAENIKRLKAVDITPNPGDNTVIIGGKNNAGKSSVLDAIMYALGGKSMVCDEPVMRGKSKGAITCDLGELTVRRTFTKKGGGQLTVKQKDPNAESLPPQTLLNKLTGDLTFDPVAFMSKDRKGQADILRRLVGVDTSDIDGKIKATREDRTVIGRLVKEKKGARDEAEGRLTGERPAERVDMGAVIEKLDAANLHNADCNKKTDELQQTEGKIEDIAQEIRGLKEKLNMFKSKESDLVKWLAETQPIDTAPIAEKIGNAEKTNALVAQHERLDELDEAYTDAEVEYSDLTEKIEAMEEKKATMLTTAKFPIEGLAIEDDIVMFKGVPLDQAGAAEQMRVSAAIGLAQNPELKVMLVRDGSLMDDDSKAAIREIAKEHDAQLWIEMVGEGDKSAIIIEEGEVRK